MRVSRRALAWAWLRATTWRERAAMAFVAMLALGVVAATLLQGYHIGAHIWRPGWICGHTSYNGSPFCVRDPNGGM